MRSIPKMSIFIKKSYLHMPKMGLLYIIPRGGLGSEWVEKNQTFPYSEEGLQAALAFSESLEPKREAFWNRETDC